MEKNERCDRCGSKGKLFLVPEYREKGVVIDGHVRYLCKEHLDEYSKLIREKFIPKVLNIFEEYSDKNGVIVSTEVGVKTKVTKNEDKQWELKNKISDLYSQYTRGYFTDRIFRDVKSPKERHYFYLNFYRKDRKSEVEPFDYRTQGR